MLKLTLILDIIFNDTEKYQEFKRGERTMPGALFALIILPLLIIGTSVVLYYVSGKPRDKKADRVKEGNHGNL
jgi:hypothetical protein